MTGANDSDADVATIFLDQADRIFSKFSTMTRLTPAQEASLHAAQWELVSRTGLPRALAAEDADGAGLSLRQGLLIVKRAAYYAFPIPLGEAMLAHFAWPAALADEEIGIAPCLVHDLDVIARENCWVVNGALRAVPWGHHSKTVMAVAATKGEPRILLVDPKSCAIEHGRNLAGEPRDTLFLRNIEVDFSLMAPVPSSLVCGTIALGALLRAQQLVGSMERCIDYAVEHANQREQFGRVIGTFQAVQHMIAVAAGHFAAASAAVERAVDAYGKPGFVLEVGIAKARASEAAGVVAATAHQILGAMGFTDEHPLHNSTLRLWSWRDEFGNESYWHSRIGATICAAPSSGLWDFVSGAVPALGGDEL